MSELYLRMADEKEVARIYEQYIKKDFPDDEVKPLSVITRMMDEGAYDPLVLTDGEQVFGYAFMARDGGEYLLDYLAVINGLRGCGYGSRILSLLGERYADARSIIVEVEDPDCALSDTAKETMVRRIDFYMRAGLRDTGARVKTFGVDFCIIELPVGRIHDPSETEKIYLSIYDVMITREKTEQAVIIKRTKAQKN